MSKSRDRSRRHWRRQHADVAAFAAKHGPLLPWQRTFLAAVLQGDRTTPPFQRAYLSPLHAATSKGGDPK